MELTPPNRSLRAFAPLSVSTPPRLKFVVTKPSLPVAWSRTTASPKIENVPSRLAELSPERVQSPEPILVTLSCPVV